MILHIYTDGGARGNPGPAAIGVVIKKEESGIETLLYKFGKKIGDTTNNTAEYQAVIEALRWLGKNPINNLEKIHFFLDSKLVASQLAGIFKVKESHLRSLIIEVRLFEAQINVGVLYNVIPRERNKEADWEVNKALNSTQ